MAKKRKDRSKADGHKASLSSSQQPPPPASFESFPPEWLPPTTKKQPGKPAPFRVLHPGRIWVVPSFFSERECRVWVEGCEASGRLRYTAHPATYEVAHRECYRMQDNGAGVLADRVFERLRSVPGLLQGVHEEIERLSSGDRRPIGCNPNLRVYKYLPGHSFGKHVDGSNEVFMTPSGCKHHPPNAQTPAPSIPGMTELTILVYLSECEGGATRFYTEDYYRRSSGSAARGKSQKQNNHKKATKGGSKNKAPTNDGSQNDEPGVVAFQPQLGAVLLHVHGEHCLEHEADPVIEGTKYVLRTDLVFGEAP